MTHKIGKRFYSIKFRLMALITLILLLVVGLPLSLFVYQLDKNYEEFSVNMIETASQVVYQFIYDGMIKNDSILIQKNIDLLALDPSIALVRLYRPGGKILYSSEHDEIKKSIKDLPDNVAFFKSNSGEFEIFHRHENVYAHNHAIRVQEECLTCHQDIGKTIAILDVHAGITSSEQLYTTLKKLAIFGGALIIILLWFILGFLYQTQIENKLHAIVLGFDRLSKRDFNFKITIPGKHELAMLADKFNQMVDNLNRARNKEEKFLIEKMARADRLVTLGEVAAEIAHEVNNPASIILTFCFFILGCIIFNECLMTSLILTSENVWGIFFE
jgi:methyl-accepting chemotaxis protein